MADTFPNSTIAEHLKYRSKPRTNQPLPTTTIDPPQMPSIIQSTGCKSTISSLIISTFTNTPENNNAHPKPKKNAFKNSSFSGFGCTAQPEVTVPSVIRSSADWEENERDKSKKNKKKKKKQQQQQQQQQQLQKQQLQSVLLMDDSFSGVQDLWCSDASAAASVDCVRPLSSRGKIDLHKFHPRERPSYSSRQRVNAEPFTSMGLDSSFDIPHFGPDVFEARYYHHLRNRSPEGLAEILMCRNGLMANRRSAGPDIYREWRLDVDHMTYEELLELGDRIGYVSTGLAEDQIGKCVRKTKLPVVNELPSQPHKSSKIEGKCSICQEEYEEEDEVGKLECGHDYHLHCIKQWLLRRNACPVCKAEVSSL